MNHEQMADHIIFAVGGKDNILAATHCATRLRLVLKDENEINRESLEALDTVKGHFLTAGQFQIILGTGTVNLVTEALLKATGAKSVSTAEAKNLGAQKGNIIQRAVKVLSDIFVPIIPAIVAGGLLMGINNVLTAPDLIVAGKSLIEAYPQWSALADMINTFANAPFVFLPILIAFSATKIFGGNPFLGAVLGMIMVHPALTNNYGLAQAIKDGTLQYWEFFGHQFAKVGYQGTVLPILVCSWILAKLEINIRKIVPSSLDIILTPLLSVFITAILTFSVVGPFTRDLGVSFTDGVQWLYNSMGAIGGALFGAIYAPIVITGLHNSFIPIETQLIADVLKTGGTFIFPIAAMNNVAQGAAAFAVLWLIKDAKLKSVASASGVSALLGITEPAMFGVNLRLRYPFYAALAGTAIASAFITLFKVKAVALGSAGLVGVISVASQSLMPYVIGMMIAFGATFAFTMMLAKSKYFNAETSASVETPKSASQPVEQANSLAPEWVMPLSGEILPLSAVPDEAFASGAMGAGFAIQPTNHQVVSPVNGTIVSVFPTKHAIGIEADNGLEILLHIGIDTVKLNGEGFTAHVQDGQKIKAGDLLLTVDFAQIGDKVPSIMTPIIFTALTNGEQIEIINNQPVIQS